MVNMLMIIIVGRPPDNIFLMEYKNSGALVHQRTIPTERPLLVGEVSANKVSEKLLNINQRQQFTK
jgi:hypothetical protein